MNAKGKNSTQMHSLELTVAGAEGSSTVGGTDTFTDILTDAVTDAASVPKCAIFTLPKSFEDPHTACIQRNAIASWRALGDNVEVILIGDETGIADAADELGAIHVNHVQRNEHGTPLVSDALKSALANTVAEVLVFCNSDVILLHDFKNALADVMRSQHRDRFMAIGRRTNLNLRHPVDFGDRFAVLKLLQQVDAEGAVAPIVCKEYFAFTRNQFTGRMPPFAVGRGNWDNWMVADTKRQGVPVIDLSNQVTAIHQNHDYQHIACPSQDCQNPNVKLRRKHCYFSGPEARENQRLAKGKHVIAGSTSTHRLTDRGVVKKRWASVNLDFWMDLPRFGRLLRQLFFG